MTKISSFQPQTSIGGVILAGGRAMRMGGADKPLLEINGESLLSRVIRRLSPQVSTLVINANGPADRFAAFGLPVAADVIDGHQGPLAGVLTGMEWFRRHAPDCRWMVSVAADTPLFPTDLVARLLERATAEAAHIAMAQSNGRNHPVFTLWPVALADDLRRAMVDEEIRKVGAWITRYPTAPASWPTHPFDPFFNVNTPDDAELLAEILKRHLYTNDIHE